MRIDGRAAPPLAELPWGGAVYGVPQRAEAWFQTRWAERSAMHACVSVSAMGMYQLSGPPCIVPTETYADVTIWNAASASFADPHEMQCTP